MSTTDCFKSCILNSMPNKSQANRPRETHNSDAVEHIETILPKITKSTNAYDSSCKGIRKIVMKTCFWAWDFYLVQEKINMNKKLLVVLMIIIFNMEVLEITISNYQLKNILI